MSIQAGPSNLRRTDSGTLVELVSEISSVPGDMSNQVQGGGAGEYQDELQSVSSGDGKDLKGDGGVDVSDDEWDMDDSSVDEDDDGDEEEEGAGEDDEESDDDAESNDERGSEKAGERLTLEDGESSVLVSTCASIG